MFDDIELDVERVYESIEKGVYKAIWAIATNATDAPCSDFYHHIKEGVRQAMEKVGDNE